jgi:hypothetical protein
VKDARGVERRRGKRARARLAIRLWNDGQQAHGLTADLSSSGMFVETPAVFEIGTRIHFEIQHPDGPFLGEAIVVRKKKVPANLRTVVKPGVGLSLIPLTALLARGEVPTPTPTPLDSKVFDLQLDLSDPAQLSKVHEGELRGGVLFVAGSAPPPIGATVRVHVSLPPPYASLAWRGRVVQQSEQPAGAAVELSDRTQVDTLVREILDALRG